MIRWWHPSRYHVTSYTNWVVLWFARPGQLNLRLQPSRWDRVESCWRVSPDGSAKKCTADSGDSTGLQFVVVVGPRDACAVMFLHDPMQPDHQGTPAHVGRATFVPEKGVPEHHDLVLEHASGKPKGAAPTEPITVVRSLVTSEPRWSAPPTLEVHARPDDKLELCLARSVEHEVTVYGGDGASSLRAGDEIDVGTLEQLGFRYLVAFPARTTTATLALTRDEFFAVPAVMIGKGRAVLGKTVHFVNVSNPGPVKAEFVWSGALHLRWSWANHPRMRLSVRAYTPWAAVEPIVKPVTRHDYEDRGFALVTDRELNRLLDAGATTLEVTIEVLRTDDTASEGPALASSTTVVPVAKERVRQ